MEAYCFKCRDKREIRDPQRVSLRKGRPATRGVCSTCGTQDLLRRAGVTP